MIEQIEISKLILLENNPRKITKDQFDKLCKSLNDDPDFFNHRPCLINRKPNGDLIVYAGNQRVRAAQKLKWKTVPCSIEDDLDEELMKSRVAKDNQHFGTWDYDILGNEWDIDILLDSGFTQSMLDGAFTPIVDIEGELPEKKDKKKKVCPNCSFEY